jgi:hypothetical protein
MSALVAIADRTTPDRPIGPPPATLGTDIDPLAVKLGLGATVAAAGVAVGVTGGSVADGTPAAVADGAPAAVADGTPAAVVGGDVGATATTTG